MESTTASDGMIEANPLVMSPLATSIDNSMKIDHHDDVTFRCYTTISLLVILHMIFFYQWNTLKTRQDVQYTYRIVVLERQFHRAVLGLLSHAGESVNNNRRTLIREESGSTTSSSSWSTTTRSLVYKCCVMIKSLYRTLTRGSLSGLPLLAYTSHVLYEMRHVLERDYSQGSMPYLRTILTLLFTSTLLEFVVQSCLLQLLRGGASASSPLNSAMMGIMARGTSGLSSLLTALLVLFLHVQSKQYYAALVPVAGYAPYHRFKSRILTQYLVAALLSYRTHRWGHFMGACAGTLYTTGITSFLSEPYWNNFLLLCILLSCAVSIKAKGGIGAEFVPCVDYVSWDVRGGFRVAHRLVTPAVVGTHHQQEATASADDNMDEEGEEDVFVGDNGGWTMPQDDHDVEAGRSTR